MGELILFVGPMFSGKSTKLISEVDRYRYKGKRILLIKPGIDKRYSDTEAVTHSGAKLPCSIVNNCAELMELNPETYDVIAVDEAFMIDGIGEVLVTLYLMGKTILISSLDLSSDVTPFKELSILEPYATKIKKCSAICGVDGCYEEAWFTYKKNIKGAGPHDEVQVGGKDMYEPRCSAHHPLVKKMQIKNMAKWMD